MRHKRREPPTIRLSYISREAIALYRGFRDFHQAVSATVATFGQDPASDLAALRDAIDLAVERLQAPEHALSEASYLVQNAERLDSMRQRQRRNRGSDKPPDRPMAHLPEAEPEVSFEDFIEENRDLYADLPAEDFIPKS